MEQTSSPASGAGGARDLPPPGFDEARGMPDPEAVAKAVIRELSAIAFADFTDYVRTGEDGVLVTSCEQLTPRQRAAVASIKDTGKGVEIKLYDKQRAIETLVKYLGLFDRDDAPQPIRVELAGPVEAWSE